MEIYLDRFAHKTNYFQSERQRDEAVEELRKNGWTVKTKCFNFSDPILSSVFAYEAIK